MSANMTSYPGLTAEELSELRYTEATEKQIAITNQRNMDKMNEKLKRYTQHIVKNPDGAWEGKELRLVLLGNTGAGKSTLGNLIIGKEEFKRSIHSTSCTQTIKEKSGAVDGVTVRIIDTPGFNDTEKKNVEILTEIAKVFDTFKEGIHGFLFVFNAGSHRFTKEQQRAFDQLKQELLGTTFSKWCYLVLSHGDAIIEHCSLNTFLEQERKEMSIFGKVSEDMKDRIILVEDKNRDYLKELQRQQVVRLVCSMGNTVYRYKEFEEQMALMKEKMDKRVHVLVPLIEKELSKLLQDKGHEELANLRGKPFDMIAEKAFQEAKGKREEWIPDKPLREAVQILLYGKKERLANPTFLDKLKGFTEAVKKLFQ